MPHKVEIHLENVKRAIKERNPEMASQELIKAIDQNSKSLKDFTEKIIIMEGACTKLDVEMYGTPQQKDDFQNSLEELVT